MAGTPIGRILLMPKGNYSGTAVYNSLDWVRHNGSAWVCTTDNTTGIAPAAGVPEWQLLAQDGNVSGTVDWLNVNFKPFEDVGTGLSVDVAGILKLDVNMLTGSNISYDNSASGATSNEVQGAIDELFRGAGGGGLLPILHIISEDAATVTIADTDDLSTATITITPVHTGTGVWEGEVPDYGVWYVHSVLTGQGDQIKAVNVDDVAIIPVADYHFSATITASFSNGASCTCTDGVTTLTATSNPYTFVVPNAGNWTVSSSLTLDGNTKTDSRAVSITSDGQSESVALSTEFGTITVNVAQDFITAGSTITCTKGGMSCTGKAAASTVTFRVPETGTWEIAGEISGDTYTVDAVVSSLSTTVTVDLETLPDGSTVLPTDDIQTWLKCAGINDKTSYTTLADVLGDATTLLALMSDNNAVDYLVRSKSWTGKGLVPVMTDATHPSGEASASGQYSTNYAWKAFDGDDATAWYITAAEGQLYYEFPSAVKVTGAYVKWESTSSTDFNSITFKGYDGSQWVELGSVSDTHASATGTFEARVTFNNNNSYTKYGLFGTTVSGHYLGHVVTLQYYDKPMVEVGIPDDSTAMTDIGANNYCADALLADSDWCEAIVNSEYIESVLNVKVPTLSGDDGNVLATSYHGSEYPWYAFDNSDNTDFYNGLNNPTGIGYHFVNQIKVYGVKLLGALPTGTSKPYTIQLQSSSDDFASDENNVGSSWDITVASTSKESFTHAFNHNSSKQNAWRIKVENTYSVTSQQYSIMMYTLQFYGREDV